VFQTNTTPMDANTVVSSLSELVEINKFGVFPNPASDQLMVEFGLTEAMPLNVSIYNTLGQQVKVIANGNYGIGNQLLETNVNDLTNGVYYIRLSNDEGQKTQKFTVIR